MAKHPKKPVTDKGTEFGTAGDAEFQKVVQTFLKTPPRQHKEDVGKKRNLKSTKRK